jgi:hypothetical protein
VCKLGLEFHPCFTTRMWIRACRWAQRLRIPSVSSRYSCIPWDAIVGPRRWPFSRKYRLL